MRPPGNAITATSSQAAFLGGSGGGLKFVWTPHSGRHSHGPLLAKSDVDLNQGSQMKDEPEEIERQRREYELNMSKILWAIMRKILWAMSPLAIVFFVLWIVAYFWVLQE